MLNCRLLISSFILPFVSLSCLGCTSLNDNHARKSRKIESSRRPQTSTTVFEARMRKGRVGGKVSYT
eukprot:819362-Amphidinium_carterae.1